jgi:hypothetical protein
MAALSPRQREMLKSYADGNEPTDYAIFWDAAGAALGWRNRERVIEALHRKGLLDADGITPAGREALQ